LLKFKKKNPLFEKLQYIYTIVRLDIHLLGSSWRTAKICSALDMHLPVAGQACFLAMVWEWWLPPLMICTKSKGPLQSQAKEEAAQWKTKMCAKIRNCRKRRLGV